MEVSKFRKFIERWNLLYPVDVWWRRKYNVPFGSKVHREANFIDMMIEWEEEKMFEELAKVEQKKKDKEDQLELSDLHKYTASGKEIKEVVAMDEDEIDFEFKNLNLADYNDKPKDGNTQ